MSNNAKSMQVIWLFPLMLTILFWQNGSCRSNQRADLNSNTQAKSAERSNEVLKGTWGGRRISMEIADDGATIEFDCANAAINDSFVADRNGRFDLKGTYEVERPGPQRAGPSSNAQPARFTGSVNGKSMTLNITLTDTNESIGEFTLTHGVTAQIVKCR